MVKEYPIAIGRKGEGRAKIKLIIGRLSANMHLGSPARQKDSKSSYQLAIPHPSRSQTGFPGVGMGFMAHIVRSNS